MFMAYRGKVSVFELQEQPRESKVIKVKFITVAGISRQKRRHGWFLLRSVSNSWSANDSLDEVLTFHT